MLGLSILTKMYLFWTQQFPTFLVCSMKNNKCFIDVNNILPNFTFLPKIKKTNCEIFFCLFKLIMNIIVTKEIIQIYKYSCSHYRDHRI